MKKARVLLLIAVLLVPAMLFAAGAQEAAKPVEKTIINFPTAATTGAVYPLGAAICNLWNNVLPNVRASAQASAGGIANLNMIADGEAQLGVAVTSIMYESFNGIGSFAGRANPNLRVMIGLYANPNQVVVTNNSGIESLAGLAGKRFASGAPGSTTEVETSIHLKTSGIKYPEALRGPVCRLYRSYRPHAEQTARWRLDHGWYSECRGYRDALNRRRKAAQYRSTPHRQT